MAATAVVTADTNRIETFCRRHLGGDTDEIRHRFITWNREWMNSNRGRTLWLPIGQAFYVTAPPNTHRRRVIIGGRTLTHGGRYFTVPWSGAEA